MQNNQRENFSSEQDLQASTEATSAVDITVQDFEQKNEDKKNNFQDFGKNSSELRAGAKPLQSAQDNAAFAQNRRKQELEKTRQELYLQKKENEKLKELSQQFSKVEADSEQTKGISVVEENTNNTLEKNLEQQIDSENFESQDSIDSCEDFEHQDFENQDFDSEESLQNAILRQENDFFRKQYRDNIILNDVNKINEKYPDIEDFSDLPQSFFAIMATGAIKDPVAVYEILAKRKQTPPPLGSVKSTQTMDKDYYSPEEVDRLSSKQLDEKTMNKIFNSMKKWK